MHPEICKIGPFTVYSYGLMLAIAFIAGSTLACKQARKENISPEMVFNLSFLLLICGILGARLFYVVENLRYYIKNPLEIIMLQYGGLAWFGGLIAAVIAGAVYLKIKKLSVSRMADLIVPFVALGQAIGRIGCFLNGCCYGYTVIPTQIYSSFLLLVIFVILRFLQERPHKEGTIFLSYLFLYSLKRFFIEFLRADNPVVLWGLTLFQLLSIVGLLVSVLMFIRLKAK